MPYQFSIAPVGTSLSVQLDHKIANKTKPPGALGRLESLARQVGLIQQSLTPSLSEPAMLVFAADHGVVAEGVSPYPQEVTAQMVSNFLAGGAAINCFCRLNGIRMQVIDAGVRTELPAHPALRNCKLAAGSANMTERDAMTAEQCDQALAQGAALVDELYVSGTNVIGFGEMGIGNTTSAAALMSALLGLPATRCVGRGTGLDDAGVVHKAEVVTRAVARLPAAASAWEILKAVGGLEIAMMTGAMLQAAARRMAVLVDGFIATSAALVASRLAPDFLGYAIFSHRSDEQPHQLLLEHLNATPLLDLGMRLGEGTGAALAYPLVEAAVAFLNEMASFDSAGVSQA